MNDLFISEPNRTYHEAQSQMELLPNYYAWTYGVFLPYIHGTVVELGSGAGLGIAHYIQHTKKVYAVDFNGELLSRARALLPGDRLQTIQADLTDDWDELAHIKADAIIMMDVVEHFADDTNLIAKAAALLKPGGHMLIKVPANRSLYSPMDEASGHYRRYNREDFKKLADKARLKIERISPVNRAGALAYRFKNKQSTNFSKSFSPSQLKLINTLLPMVRLFDKIPGLPGLSLVAVLKHQP